MKSRLMIYVACSSSEIEFPHRGQMITPIQVARNEIARIKELGHTVSYDWPVAIEEEKEMSKAQLVKRTRLVIDMIDVSDALIFIPTPNQQFFGASLEIGSALTRGLPGGVIVAQEYHPTFNHFFLNHPSVKCMSNVDHAVQLARTLVR